MTSRMAERIGRDCVELGSEGRLIRLQLDELVGNVPTERDAIVRDYHAAGAGAEATAALEKLRDFRYEDLIQFDRLVELLGFDRGISPLDFSVSPRGYRVLSHIPRIPDGVIRRIVEGFGTLDTVVRASQRDLEGVEGVGAVRAREIRAGLRRLQEHNLVDRYLQL
jgi:diadenylate cyclase